MIVYRAQELSRLANLKNKKEQLDNLLLELKAQPVGIGYIDIIVTREMYKRFICNITETGFLINDISWWVHYEKVEQMSEYGYGGPVSIFYNGWFSEIFSEKKELSEDYYLNFKSKKDIQLYLRNIIENKRIDFPDNNYLTFRDNLELTPAFWLDVPDDWKNKQKDVGWIDNF